MHDDLLTIGRFARLCRLSVKRLRHYDELGLLSPVRVDAASGYRYYAPGQARDALTIALLREMDLPLPVIARALAAAPEPRARILRAERDRLAERIRRDQARLALLERLAEGGLPGYEVETAAEPERRLAVVRAEGAPERIGEVFGACAGRLLAALGGAGAACDPPLWGLYPLDPADPMEVAAGAAARPGEAPPGLETVALPGGPVVRTTHTGPYAQLPLAYNALFAAVHERGLRPLAPVRETYLVGPREAAPDELVTRVAVPVEEGAA
ncbi:MerR family transcriptional regulator [Streptomonospora nanhaiensis]|uniref:DNA-binding transcriptional MerR regulator n=1 Tax=Streptomonospora nanhaiensis TaxID=1323731 RepID=A0A853BI23_9ACTN|nr:MerR family transcriptional regulator [Streptomonospora nanhaiensis]MBV2364184.1 MerR family transcriptional regulator [Streptomonospora nanhaiensis]MBX9386696.1 MerR family transcriptional regulator [Streptomonospora nanhaiensis]NYI95138.1 DNA-binding transcriptional MerR regulator [Streptomonospora nanhaiensis]